MLRKEIFPGDIINNGQIFNFFVGINEKLLLNFDGLTENIKMKALDFDSTVVKNLTASGGVVVEIQVSSEADHNLVEGLMFTGALRAMRQFPELLPDGVLTEEDWKSIDDMLVAMGWYKNIDELNTSQLILDQVHHTNYLNLRKIAELVRTGEWVKKLFDSSHKDIVAKNTINLSILFPFIRFEKWANSELHFILKSSSAHNDMFTLRAKMIKWILNFLKAAEVPIDPVSSVKNEVTVNQYDLDEFTNSNDFVKIPNEEEGL